MSRHRTDSVRRSDRHSVRKRKKHFYKGISVVPGVAMGTVHLKFRQTQILSNQTITEADVDRELAMLDEAVRRSKESLLIDQGRVDAEVGELEATIFDAHILILEDRVLMKKIREQVRRDLHPVESVVSVIVEGYYQTMRMVEDEILQERAADIRDVGMRLLDCLIKLKHQGPELEQAVDDEMGSGDIIFARELLPSDIAALERNHVTAVVTEAGNGRGHAAVMLRAMGVPTVMGVEDVAEFVKDGDFLIVDGSAGTVFVNPRKDVIESYRKTLNDYQTFRDLLDSEVQLPTHTTDDHHLSLLGNISKRSEVDLCNLYRMDGVGLYRTEFHLMIRSSFPTEDEQYKVYRDVVEGSKGQPVTIRTMDIGTDKQLSYLKLPEEENQALGRRSIRLAFDLDEFQLTQLRAILRASVHGPIQLMFPFITAVEDIRLAKRMLRQAKRQLDGRGEDYAKDIPIGMMVEVPAAALSLEQFVREVDFFSVGTNDLVQYVCAADRNQPEVATWYKGYNPGVLRILRQVAEVANNANKPLTICGEMAGDPFYTMFLVGIGVKRLSMSAPQVPLVKKIIRSISLAGAKRLVDRSMQYSSTSQIRHLFQDTVEQILGRDLTSWTRQQDS